MFMDSFSVGSGSGEGSLSGFPVNGLGYHTGRCFKTYDIEWNVIWLNHILCVVVFWKTPAGEFNIKLATIVFRSNSIPGKQSQNSAWFHMRNIAYRKPVCTVTEAARKLYLSASPFGFGAIHA